MSVIKVIELVGTSNQSWEDAVQSAVGDASKTLKNVEAVDITNMSATVQDGKIDEWMVDVRVSFRIEDTLRPKHHMRQEEYEAPGGEKGEMSHI